MKLIAEPAPSFDDPIGLLRACHERIISHCDILERLAEHLSQVGADPEAQQAAARIRRYFEISGPAHHADEEVQLFPWLLAQAKFPDILRSSVANLAAQHRQLEAAWQTLAADLVQVEAGQVPHLLLVEPFVSMNRAHVALENGEIFPIAEKLLDLSTMRSLGMAMATRRALVENETQ